MNRKIKSLALSVCLAAGVATGVNASIQQQVNSMFNSMINVTAPGAYQTASSGVITGGNIVIRNRISTVNLAHFTPPSAKGGCGGINMYMGSFSFINAEEFIGLMRNVASNAAGVASAFAFQIALEAMDSMTSGVISTLSDKMQAMNEAMLNSCQIATGIVEGAVDAYKENRDLRSATRGVLQNAAPDLFSSRRATGESPAQRVFESGVAEECKDVGNILWCAMEKSGFINQFVNGSTENAEFVMSLVGSYLVTYGPDDSDGSNFVATPIRPLEGVSLEVFIEGTPETITLYDCDSGCLNPSLRNVTGIEGLATKINQSVRNVNLFERILSGEAISSAEMNAFSWLFSSRIGTYVYQIIHLAGADAAYDFLSRHAHAIALDAAVDIITTKLDTVLSGVRELEMTDATKVQEDIRAKKAEFLAEVQNLSMNKYNVTDPLLELNAIKESANQRDDGRLSQGSSIQTAQ